MLVIFTSKVHPDVVMFGHVAMPLLRAMGQKEDPPGILRGEDIRAAAARLRAHVDMAPSNQPSAGDDDRNNTEEESQQLRNRVGLKIRVLPLLEMLDAAYAKEVDVIWR